MTWSAVDWALWSGAAALAVGATVLLAWAIRGDTARGRRRCPRCWYDMGGVPEGAPLRCPECGSIARHERRLRRTRRRWKWALAACVMGVAALGLWATPGAMRGGWPGAVPSTVLVTRWPTPKAWVAKHVDVQVVNDPVLKELDRRIDAGELARWQSRSWVRRVEDVLRDASRLGIERERNTLDTLHAGRFSVAFLAEPLQIAMDRIADELGVTITADWDALAVEGLSPDSLISMSAAEFDGTEILDALVRAMGEDHFSPIWWQARDGEVVVETWNGSGAELPVCAYHLEGMIGGEEEHWRTTDGGVLAMKDRVAAVESVVHTMIAAEDWVVAGGDKNTTTLIGPRALVRAPARAQREIERLLDAMERALTQGGTASLDEDEWTLAREVCQRLRTAKIGFTGRSVAIEDLVNGASAAGGVRTHVDWPGLAAVRVQPQFGVETAVEEISVEEALDRYVGGLVHESLVGVSWTIHRGVVRIARRDRVGGWSMLRVYNVADLVAPTNTVEELRGTGESADAAQTMSDSDVPLRVRMEAEINDQVATRIMETVDSDGWVSYGGDVGVMVSFGPCLVVRTTARNHLAIEDLLQRLREERAHPGTPKDPRTAGQ